MDGRYYASETALTETATPYDDHRRAGYDEQDDGYDNHFNTRYAGQENQYYDRKHAVVDQEESLFSGGYMQPQTNMPLAEPQSYDLQEYERYGGQDGPLEKTLDAAIAAPAAVTASVVGAVTPEAKDVKIDMPKVDEKTGAKVTEGAVGATAAIATGSFGVAAAIPAAVVSAIVSPTASQFYSTYNYLLIAFLVVIVLGMIITAFVLAIISFTDSGQLTNDRLNGKLARTFLGIWGYTGSNPATFTSGMVLPAANGVSLAPNRSAIRAPCSGVIKAIVAEFSDLCTAGSFVLTVLVDGQVVENFELIYDPTVQTTEVVQNACCKIPFCRNQTLQIQLQAIAATTATSPFSVAAQLMVQFS